MHYLLWLEMAECLFQVVLRNFLNIFNLQNNLQLMTFDEQRIEQIKLDQIRFFFHGIQSKNF